MSKTKRMSSFFKLFCLCVIGAGFLFVVNLAPRGFASGVWSDESSSVTATTSDTACDNDASTLVAAATVVTAATKKAPAIDGSEEGSAYAADRIMVTFAATATSSDIENIAGKLGAEKIEALADSDGVTGMTSMITLPAGTSVAEAAASLEHESSVIGDQPDFIYRVEEDKPSIETPMDAQSSPMTNDVDISEQWSLRSIDIADAWKIAKVSGTVSVAVVDTGCDMSHPDLVANLDSAHAYDVGSKSNSVSDTNGHGTHVAGIVAAASNNGIGVSGVSYNARIVPVDVADSAGCIFTSSLIKAYRYILSIAHACNIRVINMSLGGFSNSMDANLAAQIDTAYQAGILTVCAAGNGDGVHALTDSFYPGDYTTCISVVNLAENGVISNNSCYGSDKDIAAPGSWILSTTNDGAYGYKSGTSMAAPVVSGVAALLFADDQALSCDEVKQVLYNTATDLGAPGFDSTYGWGEVNPVAALQDVNGRKATDISGATVGPITDQAYTGLAIEPAVNVSINGAALRQDTDYTVAYADNIAVGTATVTILGIGSYKGVLTKTFAIVPVNYRVTTRLAGDGALDTMNEIVDAGFAGIGGTVVIATDAGYWDALTANGVAGLVGAPVLLTDGFSLSVQTANELKRLQPASVIICGGSIAVSDAVASQIKGITGIVPQRCCGQTATGTACDIYKKAAAYTGKTWMKTAFIATSKGYWDALSIAPYAYSHHCPIFLSEDEVHLSNETVKTMVEGGITSVIIVGGTSVISGSIENQLSAAGITVVKRLCGQTAVDTSIATAEFERAEGMTIDNMAVATSSGYWDALCGAALCGKNNSVLLLVSEGGCSGVDSFMGKNASSISNVYVFGGIQAISDATQTLIELAARQQSLS